MLSGYADENVKSAIVSALRQHGCDVVTAQERDQRETDDEALLKAAADEGRLMLTNDADFLRIHAKWIAAGKQHAGIVYWRQDKAVGIAFRAILRYALQTSAEEAANQVRFI